MMSKTIPNDYVAMATKQCPVCGEIHSHNAELLIHKNLRSIDPDKTFTGAGLCKEHDDLFKSGFIALVGVDETKSIMNADTIKPGNEYRTGEVIHMKREAFNNMFSTEIEDDMELVFVEAEVITKLKSMYQNLQDNEGGSDE